ncbi:MAG: hypothetical protein A2499_13795 [Stygiobacter sp. RIFOXYC12_FULL_38_8]|nr:MAG: hypothetical protein A2X62_02110 [Stygiobacter sp. GWC2_38_9]OGU85310.1 MAG: hypothetical protein A2279_06985 [Stygiobacter sp. RIFOXYA12_FULL_38_9]OGV07654.1 MAG: hypothetical protein A2299_05715 [Stygiobacter sp. RIFOXYB2_FULL_37_11]OGV10816.1 MAG: hypothetical protein A2237_00595 [Stygiobacter sp. RIFOXYA2_FULL_38_8]OGV12657.1 MAG: hypothetical protein A2440_15550 [Stygiobacter sp. RIFOXYC2_FULL_38_25]OGV26915.1 MAG: hypothetical protein A2499_13795 [Stygiobacter sp. RIFOXYC12_FULL_
MKPSFFLILFVTAVLITLSCKEEITKPVTPIEPPKVIEPGRRDYVWNETIIKSSMRGRHYLWFHSTWAASPTDIWAVAIADSASEYLWRYDGVSWKAQEIISYMTNIRQIWGLSANSVWACMYNGEFFHYDGKEWKRHSHVLIEGHDYFRVQRMWGRGDGEIYAIGNCFNYNEHPDSEGYGVLIKYDGKEWKQIEIPKVYELFTYLRKDKWNNVYILGHGYMTGIDKLYCYDGSNFKELMSSSTRMYLGDITTDIIAINNKKAYKLINGEAIEWVDFKGDDFTFELFGGKSEKDMFGNNNGILHYNGTDIQKLYPFYFVDFLLNSIWLFEKDVFFFIKETKTLNTKVLHGKLN